MISPTLEQVPHGMAMYFRDTLNFEHIDVGSVVWCRIHFSRHTTYSCYCFCVLSTKNVNYRKYGMLPQVCVIQNIYIPTCWKQESIVDGIF